MGLGRAIDISPLYGMSVKIRADPGCQVAWGPSKAKLKHLGPKIP